jgi:hypothetical protein
LRSRTSEEICRCADPTSTRARWPSPPRTERASRLDVDWRCSDLLADLPDAFDAIVANPPYVERAAIAALEPEVSRHEPRHALDGGPSGLDRSPG